MGNIGSLGMYCLEYLNLSFNRNIKIIEGIEGISLIELNMQANSIVSLENTLNSKLFLKILKIGGNNIESLSSRELPPNIEYLSV
jgi:hypothetical protein